MAEGSDADRTEPASQRRIEKAREQGQLARSRELVTALVIFGGFAVLWFSGSFMLGRMLSVMRVALAAGASVHEAPEFGSLLFTAARSGALVAIPMLLVSTLCAVGGCLALGGWVFSAEALAPRVERLDPFSGLKRLWSAQSAAELGKAIAKVVLIAATGYAVFHYHMAAIVALAGLPSGLALARAMRIILLGCLLTALPLVLLAAVDVPWQMFHHVRQLRMSKEEVRREFKESEGDPQIKRRIRQGQLALARRRMMAQVPKANVVVTNPTQFAVALRYAEGERAPRVVARGRGDIAEKIREIARANHVPLLEAPPLARALYAHVELDQVVPEVLYDAVAQVLAWVYQLRRWENGLEASAPLALTQGELRVPPALDPHAQEVSIGHDWQ
ncbi:MAG: flagellar biosynthesis protein FlhB [Candidimonas sp.]|nr:MAG: flagellar biosynthesis protein FlhB [Candidimonas sp.]